MEPIATTSAALASIIGLIGQFKAGRDGEQAKSYSEFIQWLADSRHEELRSLIEANQLTTVSIKAILNQSNQALAANLQKIDAAIASFSTTVAGFDQLGQSLHPNSALSDQAISILRQIDGLNASKILLAEFIGGRHLMVFDGHGGDIDIEEDRFLESDLDQLASLGLLIAERNSQGNRIWTFTRAASSLLKALQ